MDEASFAQFKEALAGRLTEQAKNLRERNARYLADLEAGVTTFDSQQQIADIVRGLKLADVTEHLELTLDRLESARLLVFSRGQFNSAPANGRMLPDAGALKASRADKTADSVAIGGG